MGVISSGCGQGVGRLCGLYIIIYNDVNILSRFYCLYRFFSTIFFKMQDVAPSDGDRVDLPRKVVHEVLSP